MKKLKLLLASALALSGITHVNTKAESRVDQLLKNMTLDQKIGQMLMPDFRQWKAQGEEKPIDFTVINREVAQIIDRFDLGGVILFAQNVKTTEQTLQLTHDLQMAATNNESNNGNIPLLLSIDQEGGVVYRLGSGTALPGNMAIGATRNVQYAKDAGAIIGRELNALGINTNFAPVLDVNNNPLNPVIGLRSFSSDPHLVGELGIAMMKGMQENNVITAAKHFPGHGDTAVDSHVGLPIVDKTKEELLKTELKPFKLAIENGVDMLMSAHIQYPQLEADKMISKKDNSEIYLPATLSDDIMKKLVREEMGYDGIIVSDAMNMQAIADHFGESDATILAIKADVDIVLMPTVLRSEEDIAKLQTIVDNVKQAVNSGEIPLETIDKSVTRILKLKEKRGILDTNPTQVSFADKLANAKQVVGSDLNRALEREIAAAAVTLVKNEDNVLPFKLKENDKLLLLGAYNNELPGMELSVRRFIAEERIPSTTTYEAYRYSKATNFETDLKTKLDEATHIIVISEISRAERLAQDFWLTKIPTEVVNYANEKNKPVAILSIAHPYDVANYPNAKAIVTVYGAKGMDPTEGLKPDAAFGPNIPAGVEVILGRDALGKLPVDIPVIKDAQYTNEIAYPLGHGLMYNKSYTQTDAETGMTLQLNRMYATDDVAFNIVKLDKKLEKYADSVVYDITATLNGKVVSDFAKTPVTISVPTQFKKC